MVKEEISHSREWLYAPVWMPLESSVFLNYAHFSPSRPDVQRSVTTFGNDCREQLPPSSFFEILFLRIFLLRIVGRCIDHSSSTL
jgi:hypothetical protein